VQIGLDRICMDWTIQTNFASVAIRALGLVWIAVLARIPGVALDADALFFFAGGMPLTLLEMCCQV